MCESFIMLYSKPFLARIAEECWIIMEGGTIKLKITPRGSTIREEPTTQ